MVVLKEFFTAEALRRREKQINVLLRRRRNEKTLRFSVSAVILLK